MTATARLITGNRLHLQHGPIDLIIGADGDQACVEAAYVAAVTAFRGLLDELVSELPLLRAPIGGVPPALAGGVARRMAAAVWPYRAKFITPMAAVAGSVADHVLAAMRVVEGLQRIYVNNGGDIALHLEPGKTFTAGLIGDLAAPAIDARIEIKAGDGIGGIATSGWRGRSQSLGIADAVTVLARDGAAADAAATVIANAVDVDNPAVTRRPAHEVKDDSDLGDLLVTVNVAPLPPASLALALGSGRRRAAEIHGQHGIVAAYIQLQGEIVIVGDTARVACAA